VPARGLPCTTLLEMSTKPVTTRAITATRVGCVQRWLGRETPGAKRCSSSAAAEDDPRPSILQLNTERLTANKISVIEQLTYKNKAFIIVVQEVHCTTEHPYQRKSPLPPVITVTTGNGKRSRLRHLKSGVPQGSVLALLLFNICISDLPTIVSRKYAYAVDLAIMHANEDWHEVGAEQGHGNAR